MHVWDKTKYYKKSYDLLKAYGILLHKKHHRQQKGRMLKKIKEFSKRIVEKSI